MRKTYIYNRELFVLYKDFNPYHFHDVIENRSILFTLKRKPFRVLENVEHSDHCSFYMKIENFGFVLNLFLNSHFN